MKKTAKYLLIVTISWMAISCGSHNQTNKAPVVSTKPTVGDSGRVIKFPPDSVTLSYFKTAPVTREDLNAELTAPGMVAATVVFSKENSDQNLVLFDNPELTANYTAMLQHIINIRQKGNIVQQRKAIVAQKQIELDRFKDLAAHGAGTGKDVSDAKTDLISAETDMAIAQTELSNERTSIIEHLSRLKLAGFDPQELIHPPLNKTWVICEMPDNQVTKVKKNGACKIQFTSYPGEIFNGTIEDIGGVIDNVTRMVKLRIGIKDTGNKLKAGMFASVKFGVNEGNSLSIPKSALVTVQGGNYVFTQAADRSFHRQEVLPGPEVGGRIIIYRGLNEGDMVVTDGAMQLKGISFGY
ncbi:HlyD family efflux transporter periplasmic adaptor subunit [Chitinophaga silvatica]|uniref:HlyD family efflux transporter periplasmic adaptor subunit n=1 Tax=Chitinophaga silvatica TaxID=2282649 RepID=A0A3E1YHU4_9BACT|nr:efflux RND transporter periplasmic adaptor subunit [Chitinophaga silvatica]RFS26936.1 HlyD family efflux transporter periplasmic adaptor subunit [Chitinophaga silvatica]